MSKRPQHQRNPFRNPQGAWARSSVFRSIQNCCRRRSFALNLAFPKEKHNGRSSRLFSTSATQPSCDWEGIKQENAAPLDLISEQYGLEDFINLLQGCRKDRNLRLMKQIHLQICYNGLEVHEMVGNLLVQLFVECGSLSHAFQVFRKLINRNEHSWTSLIEGYYEFGDFHCALKLHPCMEDDFVQPSKYTYLALLKACVGLKNIDEVMAIHAQIAKEELESDLPICNSLINVYGRCGLLNEAKELLDSLEYPTCVSWTALIAGYVDHGLAEEALSCSSRMQLQGVYPNGFTLSCILKVCVSHGVLAKGQQIHSMIIDERHLTDIALGNALVDLYAKCQLLHEAEKVFYQMPIRDPVTSTILLAGHVDNGSSEHALKFFDQMLREGLLVTVISYLYGVKACASIGSIEKGKTLHIDIIKKGFDGDIILGNALVDMYLKCNAPGEANTQFHGLKEQNTVSWNTLIAGYCELQLGYQAVNCIKNMQMFGVHMDETTFVCGLKACAIVICRNQGHEIHSQIIKFGYENCYSIVESLVNMYAKCSALNEAHDFLVKYLPHDPVPWTTIISTYVEYGYFEEAMRVFYDVQKMRIHLDALIFVYGLQACSGLALFGKGRLLHQEVVKYGFEENSAAGNVLMNMYLKCSSFLEACYVFDCLTKQSVISWSAFIAWQTDNGYASIALQSFEEMRSKGVSPNASIFVSTLKAIGIIGTLDKGLQTHADVVKVGIFYVGTPGTNYGTSMNIVGNALVDMYAKCGCLLDAKVVFDGIPNKNLITWNILLAGFTRVGQIRTVFSLFCRMINERVFPNATTLISIFTACSHAGLVQEAQDCFVLLCSKLGSTATAEHYNCIVDLLGRAGQLSLAVNILEKIPLQPNVTAWNAILAACRKWGDVLLAEHALGSAMVEDENQAAAFISMYNIYADACI